MKLKIKINQENDIKKKDSQNNGNQVQQMKKIKNG